MMNYKDFGYMCCGKEIRVLEAEEDYLLREVNIRKNPQGRAILLLHGFTSSPAVYREIIPSLSMYDAIYCPVLPGHAESLDAFSKATSAQWLECASQAYVSLAKDYAQIDVLGLSLGGFLAIKVAEKYPVNHLFALAPCLSLQRWSAGMLVLARVLKALGVKKLSNAGGDLHSKDFQEITYRFMPLPVAIQLLSLIVNNHLVLPNCKTDLFLGKYDQVVDSNAVANLFKDSKLTTTHWLNNSAHVLPLDGDLPKIISVIEDRFYSSS